MKRVADVATGKQQGQVQDSKIFNPLQLTSFLLKQRRGQ